MPTALAFLALAATASAATISIDVGQNGALTFNPDSVTAAVGDTLEFHFFSGSGGHSVVSSTFSTPCQPAPDAFFSGYIPGDDSGDMTFVTTVNSTDPIWFYCSLPGHCQAGMVGAVNPPAGQTVSDYANAAQSVMRVSAPAEMQGGVLTTIAPSSAAGTSSSSVSSMTSGSTTSTVGKATSTSASAVTTSAAVSSTGSSAGATKSASAGVGNRERSDVGALLGLAAFAGGLVALMA